MKNFLPPILTFAAAIALPVTLFLLLSKILDSDWAFVASLIVFIVAFIVRNQISNYVYSILFRKQVPKTNKMTFKNLNKSQIDGILPNLKYLRYCYTYDGSYIPDFFGLLVEDDSDTNFEKIKSEIEQLSTQHLCVFSYGSSPNITIALIAHEGKYLSPYHLMELEEMESKIESAAERLGLKIKRIPKGPSSYGD